MGTVVPVVGMPNIGGIGSFRSPVRSDPSDPAGARFVHGHPERPTIRVATLARGIFVRSSSFPDLIGITAGDTGGLSQHDDDHFESIRFMRRTSAIHEDRPQRREKILMMTDPSAATAANLDMQGFGGLDAAAKSRYALPLRFTPGVATILVVAGLVLRSPLWLGSMSFVALSGALVPRGMLIDLVYNVGLRHLFGGAPLPPTPKPRQFSYAISTAWLAGSATSFAYGLPLLGFLLGAGVVLGGTLLTTRLWCLGSWFYRLARLGDTRQWQRDRKDSAAACSVVADRDRSAAGFRVD